MYLCTTDCLRSWASERDKFMAAFMDHKRAHWKKELEERDENITSVLLTIYKFLRLAACKLIMPKFRYP